ncbi:MAG: outer membrane beta-barrel protein [Rhodospirillales bacterium]|nr:outer membrane beta-barrel protein [Rhodospirillales bacterium]
MLFIVATSVLAAPPTGPIQRIYSPTPGSDPWADVLPLEKATDQPLREPRGVHAGGFIVFPRIEIEEKYDDNIFATKNNRESDFITVISPSISVESTWSRHGLGLQAFGQYNRFAEHGTEDSEEGGVSQTGRLDITGNDYVSEFLSFSREAQDRSETDDTGSRHPPIFYRYIARTRYAHEFNDFEFRLDGQMQRFDYIAGFDFDRDRLEFSVDPRLSYRMSPYLTPFVEVGYQDRNFDASTNRSGVDPDSRTYDATLGFGFILDPTLTGEIAGGVFHTDFDDSMLDPVTSPLIEGTLSWDVTRLTTVTGNVSRREAATSTSTNSSKIVSSASLSVDHELLRNVLLGGGIRYRNEDFQDIDRVDNRFDVEVGGTYLLNPNASLSLDYTYSNRASDVDAGDFTDNSVLLSLGLQM